MTNKLKIILVNPQIHWNTGAIGRTCVALDMELIIIHPCGFEFDDAQIKRAGLDYWEFVQIKHFQSWAEFLAAENPALTQLFFFSTKTEKLYFDAKFIQGAYLVFGSETAGLSADFHQSYPDNMYKLPMFSQHIRSLNLANTATAVAYEALRQISFA
jgi:tRNA (cytidine/uridine-2'-O-)-methyltransferase